MRQTTECDAMNNSVDLQFLHFAAHSQDFIYFSNKNNDMKMKLQKNTDYCFAYDQKKFNKIKKIVGVDT